MIRRLPTVTVKVVTEDPTIFPEKSTSHRSTSEEYAVEINKVDDDLTGFWSVYTNHRPPDNRLGALRAFHASRRASYLFPGGARALAAYTTVNYPKRLIIQAPRSGGGEGANRWRISRDEERRDHYHMT